MFYIKSIFRTCIVSTTIFYILLALFFKCSIKPNATSREYLVDKTTISNFQGKKQNSQELKKSLWKIQIDPYSEQGYRIQRYTTYKVEEWKDSCLTLKFTKRKLPLTALASHPGTGNTWLRYLLQQMSGKPKGYPFIESH